MLVTYKSVSVVKDSQPGNDNHASLSHIAGTAGGRRGERMFPAVISVEKREDHGMKMGENHRSARNCGKNSISNPLTRACTPLCY